MADVMRDKEDNTNLGPVAAKVKSFLSEHHEGIWDGRSIATFILNLGHRWR
jgi:hypothetical protein